MQSNKLDLVYKIIFIIALLGVIPLLGGLGSQIGLWEPLTGMMLTYKYLMPSSICVLIIIFMATKSLVKDWKRTIATYVAILLFAGGGYFLGINMERPDTTGLRGVHDVTTDMDNPPEFMALLDAPGRTNSFDYPAETAERQKAKFPWVKPLISDLAPTEAYKRAVEVAREMNWDVVGENPAQGRFEATDYTKWFNFHDDLVVRISSNGGGSKIDLRSLSRVGGTDHGLGAKRIMEFQRNFAAK